MPTDFVFCITPLDPEALYPQVCRALEKRMEQHSRQTCPALWHLTDWLRRVPKVSAAVRARRQKRHTVLALANWLLAIFALTPALLAPGELWPVLLFGGVCLGLGAAALLCPVRQPRNAWDQEARRLLAARKEAVEKQAQVHFSQAGMTICLPETGAASETMAYRDFEQLLETEDLLVVVCSGRALLLQKKDLLTGTLAELRAFLQARTPYAAALAEPEMESGKPAGAL